MKVLGTGIVPLKVLTSTNEVVDLTLTDVAYVPEALNNLLGTKRIVKNGYTVVLKGDSGKVINDETGLVLKVEEKDDFHYIIDVSDELHNVVDDGTSVCQIRQEICDHKNCLYS